MSQKEFITARRRGTQSTSPIRLNPEENLLSEFPLVSGRKRKIDSLGLPDHHVLDCAPSTSTDPYPLIFAKKCKAQAIVENIEKTMPGHTKETSSFLILSESEGDGFPVLPNSEKKSPKMDLL